MALLSSDDKAPQRGRQRRHGLLLSEDAEEAPGGGGRALCRLSAAAKSAQPAGGDLFSRFRCGDGPVPTKKPGSGGTEGATGRKRAAPEEVVCLDDGDGTPVQPAARRQVVMSDTDGDTPAPVPARRRLARAGDQSSGGVIDLSADSPAAKGGVAAEPEVEVVEPAVVEAEEEAGVVAKCESISRALREKLGTGSVKGDRWCETEAGANTLVTHADLATACGEIGHSLKQYQLVGINFLMLLKRAQIPGAILADEMGLGKTAQTISFLGLLRSLEGDPGPHLVVVPASLLENWRRELHRWCPKLRTVVYYGKERKQMREELLYKRDLAARFGNGDAGAEEEEEEEEEDEGDDSDVEVVEDSQGSGAAHEADDGIDDSHLPFNVLLTGYSLFERDSQDQKLDREFLRKWDWSHMILDEAHALKNRNSSRTRRLRKLSTQCQRRVMLTGTPLQNDLGELAGLLQFLLPDIFTSYEELENEDISHEEAVARMKAILAPFIMRRMKSEVAKQLTQKEQVVEFIELEGEQRKLYDETIAVWCASAKASAGKAAEGGGAAALVEAVGVKRAKNIFVELRKVAQHPLLARRRFRDSDLEAIADVAYARGVFGDQCSRSRVLEELQGYSDFQLHCLAVDNRGPLAQHILPAEQLCESAKFRSLRVVIDRLRAAGSRPLIFSQWTSCLDLLGCLMDHLGLRFLRLDGNTQVAERLQLCDEFNDPDRGVFAFLLSTRAGGQGLNLTGADTVILHDVDFNPQIDRQAEDRCHRLGQTRPVTVIRLVAKNTVDDDILRIANRKLALDAAVLSSCTTEVGGASREGDEDAALAGGDEGSVQAELMRRILERNLEASG